MKGVSWALALVGVLILAGCTSATGPAHPSPPATPDATSPPASPPPSGLDPNNPILPQNHKRGNLTVTGWVSGRVTDFQVDECEVTTGAGEVGWALEAGGAFESGAAAAVSLNLFVTPYPGPGTFSLAPSGPVVDDVDVRDAAGSDLSAVSSSGSLTVEPDNQGIVLNRAVFGTTLQSVTVSGTISCTVPYRS